MPKGLGNNDLMLRWNGIKRSFERPFERVGVKKASIQMLFFIYAFEPRTWQLYLCRSPLSSDLTAFFQTFLLAVSFISFYIECY
ncbi:hypothetical protein Sps_04412 [Shewanella psychrophila]|uniref:Uncharacterized protein n=1 Tax=Shewanella psychrophila TaxID=225848 RepID=A0A1S6HVQ1_9GAMM|nr:hypothetical protein Sps_04412 [Shewanella psychrophila]